MAPPAYSYLAPRAAVIFVAARDLVPSPFYCIRPKLLGLRAN